jgi:hypothetical protein
MTLHHSVKQAILDEENYQKKLTVFKEARNDEIEAFVQLMEEKIKAFEQAHEDRLKLIKSADQKLVKAFSGQKPIAKLPSIKEVEDEVLSEEEEEKKPPPPKKKLVDSPDPLVGKNCSKCKTFLPVKAFWKDKGKDDGLSSACKNCNKISRTRIGNSTKNAATIEEQDEN